MTRAGREVELPSGAKGLYAAAPAATRGAVVNHGNPGVPAYLRELAGTLAGAGVSVLVVAGDGEVEPRRVSDVPEEERREWRTTAFAERYLALTRDGFSWLEARIEPPRRVFLVGFCGGGWQAVRLAAEGIGVAGVAAFHAAIRFDSDDPRDDLLAYVPRVDVPLQVHLGGADELTPPADVAALREAIATHALDAELYVYPGAGHGFLDPDERPSDADAREQALARLVEFLAAA